MLNPHRRYWNGGEGDEDQVLAETLTVHFIAAAAGISFVSLAYRQLAASDLSKVG